MVAPVLERPEAAPALAARLRRLRRERRLGQARLAEALGISYSAYRRYESGERELPLSIALQLADLYQVSLDALVGRTPPGA